MTTQWITFLGDFETAGPNLTFKGRNIEFQEGNGVKKMPLIGKCISDQMFDGGQIHSVVKFSEVNDSLAEIVVFNDLSTGNILTAGLGGEGYLFSIRTGNPENRSIGWQPPLAKGGGRFGLTANRAYSIDVILHGSTLRMKVDGVEVANVFLPFQPSGSQVGVFCAGSDEIRISDFSVTPEAPTAFVVMPFNETYNLLYSDVIKPVCRAHGLKPHRGDETYAPGLIIADIENQIANAKVVIAEITPNPVNPNVYYEVGYSHAIHKPTLLVADKKNTDRLPFDVSPFRVLFYENSIGGKKRIEEELSHHLRSIMPAGRPILEEIMDRGLVNGANRHPVE